MRFHYFLFIFTLTFLHLSAKRVFLLVKISLWYKLKSFSSTFYRKKEKIYFFAVMIFPVSQIVEKAAFGEAGGSKLQQVSFCMNFNLRPYYCDVIAPNSKVVRKPLRGRQLRQIIYCGRFAEERNMVWHGWIVEESYQMTFTKWF